MSLNKNIKARVGIYGVGLKAYWTQFEGLEQRIRDYTGFISKALERYSEVFCFGPYPSLRNVRRTQQKII
jgi:L-arabinose isomerase